MTRGRKPKPTHLKLIEGNPGKRPIRAGRTRPVTVMPEPPEHLNDDAREEWHRVAHGLYALRLLETVDRATLAAYCVAYARWVQAERAIAEMGKRDMLTRGLMIKTSNGNAIQNPLVGTANKAASDMVRYAAEFGMTPSARVRLSVDGGSGASGKWAGLIGGVEAG
jgi:P27 family predicted phage terminase small subunit